MTVDEIMTTVPVTTSPRATVRQALRLLHELDLRHLPVVDDGRLIGMLSDRDFRTALGPGYLDGVSSAEAMNGSVAALMSSDLVCVSPETEIAEVVDLMIEHRVGAIPVAGDDEDDLLGIVTYVDVLRAARDLF
ncbi:MAG TPA: CBS domain-containing protein [Polyangiaceae bacterium]|nr:CBS domain-containing protein [Polyangiaceae bacterium]